MMRREDFLYERSGVSRPWQFEDALRREFARARRYGSTFSLVFVALDHPDHLRDRLGPLEMGHLVRQLAEYVRRVTRVTDLIGHHNDATFSALLPETELEPATLVAERLRAMVEAEAQGDVGVRFPISVSIGVSTYRDDPTFGFEQLRYETEAALREAQREGGNRTRAVRAA